jgi:hypothetical protein
LELQVSLGRGASIPRKYGSDLLSYASAIATPLLWRSDRLIKAKPEAALDAMPLASYDVRARD